MLVKPIELSPPLNVTVIRDIQGLELLRDFFSRCGGAVGWDIETTVTKDFYWRKIRTVQFGTISEQFVIDLLPFCDNNPDTLYSSQGEYGKHLTPGLQTVLDVIEPVVCSKSWIKVGVSLSFEYMTMYFNFGLRTWNFFDCSLVERVIVAGSHSLKDYSYFSMESLMERYFHVSIDKELQTSFTLDQPLTPAQYEYAALDTRLPLSIRAVQLLILKGATYKGLLAEGKTKAAKYLEHIDPIVTGDNLLEIAEIENSCIGAFNDMHLHGERIDRDKWLSRVNRKKAELKDLIENVLDPIFLPIVGSKNEIITDVLVQEAEAKWKSYNVVSDEELRLKAALRKHVKANDVVEALETEQRRVNLEAARKAEKEKYKTICSDLKKKRTAINKLAAKCEGSALINYGSNSQLLKVLVTMKGLKRLEDLEDDTLEKYESQPVMAAIRRYHGLAKEIGTYGEQWAMEWKTKPCKEEGWLHPGDGRLHCTFNQYDAETGRSSSSQPNAQNLPQDKEVRECFIADPPDEEFPDGYRLITIDMSGAELRILAEEAQDPVWTGAFKRKEDVHCVCTEIIEYEKWPALALPNCAYYKLKEDGTPQHKKCKCPDHDALRNSMKPTNFGLPYGIGPRSLAAQIKKSEEETRELMDKHRAAFPAIWAYLEQSGIQAVADKKSFDMFGRRRLFPEPTWERAKEKAKEDRAEKLLLSDEDAERNVSAFTQANGRKPDKEETWALTHRQPSNSEVANAFKALSGNISRQGKNHRIQSANATIIKIAMGSGADREGKPFLWHTFPKYRARLQKMVHDELGILVPTRYAKEVAELAKDALRRAAALKMKIVEMDSEYRISDHWEK